MTRAEINARFEQNLSRVENLIAMYNWEGQGRRRAHDTDVLRAAIVLLHASLEDFLRSHLILNIDSFDDDTLDAYGFPSEHKRRQEKISLSQLAKYGELDISSFVKDTVRDRIERYETFNSVGDIKNAIQKCGYNIEPIENHDFSYLAAMISRRHQIVHKADRNDIAGGRGHHRTASVSGYTVSNYLWATRQFHNAVNDCMGDG